MDAQAALALDDRPDGAVLELDDLGDLGQGADRVELGGIVDVLLLGLALGDERDGSALGDRRVEGVDALLAADLERDDHLGEDDRLPECDERKLARARGRFGLLVDRGGRSLGHQRSPTVCLVASGVRGGGVGRPLLRPFGIEGFEDPSAEALLEFEQDPDTGEVDASLPGQMADPGDPTDVVLAVEADVGWRPSRAEQPLVLVDTEGSGMGAHEGRRHADDVDGPLGVALWTDGRHRVRRLRCRWSGCRRRCRRAPSSRSSSVHRQSG